MQRVKSGYYGQTQESPLFTAAVFCSNVLWMLGHNVRLPFGIERVDRRAKAGADAS